jgi:molybdate transport system regulatory protein
VALRAQLSFSAGDLSWSMGRARIRLLEAIAREGSISGAARAVGISYKAAWDAVSAMNNLFGRPLVEAQVGGRRGGGARLSEAGRRVIAGFERIEGGLARAMRALEPELEETGIVTTSLVWGFMMRTSARNALRGTIVSIREDGISAEVALEVAEGTTLYAVVTRDSLCELGLLPGHEAIALIKAPFVIIARAEDAPRTSARNQIAGTVVRLHQGGINTELTLDIGGGKTLTAVITSQSAEALRLEVGDRASALFDAAHVILAVG